MDRVRQRVGTAGAQEAAHAAGVQREGPVLPHQSGGVRVPALPQLEHGVCRPCRLSALGDRTWWRWQLYGRRRKWSFHPRAVRPPPGWHTGRLPSQDPARYSHRVTSSAPQDDPEGRHSPAHLGWWLPLQHVHRSFQGHLSGVRPFFPASLCPALALCELLTWGPVEPKHLPSCAPAPRKGTGTCSAREASPFPSRIQAERRGRHAGPQLTVGNWSCRKQNEGHEWHLEPDPEDLEVLGRPDWPLACPSLPSSV
ncbi:PREDICTED: uncharacterized protein LOC106148802 isoform X2 [Chinchilla lanigera]|uniref:uncharacterized protein LOC106148802 isoform X2 n=1 Tax=Chinchilla lanigera TaxID=34839 RepID=UPI00069656BD|nr:PREDICTED: uncharacterized protein LOC106148802 isoform X2 [Chinchilla lanigera]